MMTSSNKKLPKYFLLFLLMFIVLPESIFTQSKDFESRNLYFYGLLSETADEDSSKLELCNELFFSQFETEPTFILFDRRSSTVSQEVRDLHTNTSDLVFFQHIQKKDANWVSSIYLADFALGNYVVESASYENYYKVLIEAKDSLSKLINKYEILSYTSITNLEHPDLQTTTINENQKEYTLQDISGNWKGEQFVDKIVIMRSGKGFVIFDNGASMNIILSLKNDELIVMQESKANADFYPELPQEVALVKARESNPISWKLTIEDNFSMYGEKQTFVKKETENSHQYTEGSIAVRWYR